uniref:RxLR effector candidate protein n=1 Tax=Hyaloperonospora arabidopsidis (strain Emoy2) TaxID=559515 RepID=M4C0D0_HYAAE
MKLVADLVLAAVAVVAASADSSGTYNVPVTPTTPRVPERMGPGYPANGLPSAISPSMSNNYSYPVAPPAVVEGTKPEPEQDTKQSTNTFVVPNNTTVLTPEQLEGRGPQVPAKRISNTPSFGESDDLVFFDRDNVNKLGPKKGGGLTSG